MSAVAPRNDPALAGDSVREVAFTQLDRHDPALLEELLGVVREVAEQGAFTLGHHVEAFEQEFAAYSESEFAIGVSSGTEALTLSLRAIILRRRTMYVRHRKSRL